MKKIALFAFALGCSVLTFAQSSKDVLDKLSAKAKTWSTLSADFSSSLVDKKNNKNIKQEGNIKIKGKKYTISLSDYQIFTDGTTIWTYDKKSNTCTIDNLKDVKEGLNLSIPQINLDSLNIVHQALHDALTHKYSFITLSEKGVFYQGAQQQALIPSHVRNIADVSGAGDTVIATASLVYAATKGNMDLAAKMANIAGGLVCEEVGTMAINRDKLLQECRLLLA